jgi:hypothetical protein
MRQPNFKLDWFVSQQVLGLTHFHPEVTEADVMGVIQRGQELTNSIETPFHLLIDNRVVPMPGLLSLEQMVQMVPYANHPYLGWIVVVKPASLPGCKHELSCGRRPRRW